MFSCCSWNFPININRVSPNRSRAGSSPLIDEGMRDYEVKQEPRGYRQEPSRSSVQLFESSLLSSKPVPRPVFCKQPEQDAWLSLAAGRLKQKFDQATEGVNHFEELKKRGYNDYEFVVPELLGLTMKHLVHKMYKDDYKRDFKLSGHVEKFTPIMNQHLNMIEVYVCEKLNWDLRLDKLEEIAHKTKKINEN